MCTKNLAAQQNTSLNKNHFILDLPFKAYFQLPFREICQMMPALFMSKLLNFHFIVSQKPS